MIFFFVPTQCKLYFVFFFQAEDGIRDGHVTGVQTCALPISPGTGPANSDEESVNRTAALRVGAGVAPVCANLSQSVPQATATNLRLVCASGGDPITGYAIPAGEGPDHGTLGMTAIGSGLLTYTSVAGFSGADTFKYTATST